MYVLRRVWCDMQSVLIWCRQGIYKSLDVDQNLKKIYNMYYTVLYFLQIHAKF